MIVALGDGSLRCWDLSTGKEQPIAQPKLEKAARRSPGGCRNGVDRAVFSRDGRSVALIGGGLVQVVDLASGDRRFKERQPPLTRAACAFAPDGQSKAIVRRRLPASDQAGQWRVHELTASTIVWLDSQTGHVRREIEIPESDV